MKFMLFIYPDISVELGPSERAAIPAAVSAWVEEMEGKGLRLMGAVLSPAQEAVNLRIRGRQVSRSDGTVVQAEPHVSGFNVLECADLEEALEVASKHPVAKFGTLELRAFSDS